MAPGNSPGTLHITGNYTQNAGGALRIEIESPDSFDQLAVTGNMALGGTIEISLINGFTPAAAQSFDILSWGSLTGAFSTVIAPSQEGLTWDTSQLAMGVVSVEVTGLPGDYNKDNVVDAADYVVWRKNNNTSVPLPNDTTAGTSPADYDVWRAHFGQTAGSGLPIGSSSRVAVPEPATLVLLMLAAAGWCLRRCRTA